MVSEHLPSERRGMRPAYDDMRSWVQSLDGARHERDAAAVRRPTGQSEHVGVECANDLLDSRPGERREIHHLDLMACPQRLCAQDEQTVRRLKKVPVEVAFRIFG